MMRRTEGSARQKRDFFGKYSRDGMKLRRFYRLFKVEGRKNARYALCQHTFSRSGRSDEEHVMTACGGNFKRSFCLFLSLYVGKVEAEICASVFKELHIKDRRGKRRFVFKVKDKLADVTHAVDLYSLGHRRFACVFIRHKYLFLACVTRRKTHTQHALNASYLARKRQLAYKTSVNNILRKRERAAGAENADKHGKVISRPLLFLIRRCHIYGNIRLGKFKAAVFDSRLDPLPCLLYRRIGQSNDFKF